MQHERRCTYCRGFVGHIKQKRQPEQLCRVVRRRRGPLPSEERGCAHGTCAAEEYVGQRPNPDAPHRLDHLDQRILRARVGNRRTPSVRAVQNELGDGIGPFSGNPDGSRSAAGDAKQRVVAQLEIVDHSERMIHLVA